MFNVHTRVRHVVGLREGNENAQIRKCSLFSGSNNIWIGKIFVYSYTLLTPMFVYNTTLILQGYLLSPCLTLRAYSTV